MNTCDHDHRTRQEIRKLPYGSSGGNLLVCQWHYRQERLHRDAMPGSRVYTPPWEALAVYMPAVIE